VTVCSVKKFGLTDRVVEKKCTTTQKLKPVSVASYDSRPENEADSFSKEKISNRKKDK